MKIDHLAGLVESKLMPIGLEIRSVQVPPGYPTYEEGYLATATTEEQIVSLIAEIVPLL